MTMGYFLVGRLESSFYLYTCTNMKIKNAIQALKALSQETRLEVLRLLVRYGSTGLTAGKIADKLDANPTTLSRHLAQMEAASLISRERRAQQIIYRANFKSMQDLIGFLMEDCCAMDSGCENAVAAQQSAEPNQGSS